MEEIKNNQEEVGEEPILRPAQDKSLRQSQEKKMPLGKKIFWVIVAILIILVAVQIVNAEKYKATVLPIEGERKVGVNPTTESLDFGDLSRDTAASRTVTLKSSGTNDSYVWIIKFGALSDLIKTSESSFVLKAGEEKKIEFSVYMPASAPMGQRMNGNVWIFKIPKIF